jgi:hypothetical protein
MPANRLLSRACVAALVVALASLPVAASAGAADTLLTIDQHRPQVIERIVDAWGARLAQSASPLSIDELRARLQRLRADRLLDASVADSPGALRAVVDGDVVAKPTDAATKALGDNTIDTVYTPVTPCRLVDTRGVFAAVYQGNGAPSYFPMPFAGNEIRSYVLKGGNNTCLSQLPAALHPSAVQLQVFGMPTTSNSGDIEILPFGATFGSTATMVYIASIAFNTVSTAVGVNVENNEISVQVRGGGAHVAIDVVGYFRAASDPTSLTLQIRGNRVIRYEYFGQSPNIMGGFAGNATVGAGYAQTIAGGGKPDSNCFDPFSSTFTRLCANQSGQSFSTVSGGGANVAAGYGSAVAGGVSNTAGADYSTVVAGYSNTASGLFSTVAGGRTNMASGDYSFAAGHRAKATRLGTFMWADAREFDFVPSVDNFFGVRATGGVGLTVAVNPTTGGPTQYCNLLPGVPSWQCTSDRNAKENFVEADGRDILRRLVAMPLYSWTFKGGDPGVRSLGPTAQDFRAAFALGNSETTIAQLNVSGVALAAIKGLHELVRERDAVIDAQQRRLDALEASLLELRRAVDARH